MKKFLLCFAAVLFATTTSYADIIVDFGSKEVNRKRQQFSYTAATQASPSQSSPT